MNDVEKSAKAKKYAEDLLPVIEACLENDELVGQFNRLTGCSIGVAQSPINHLIDQTTGKTEQELKRFIEFVIEYVVRPLAAQEE